MRISIRAEYPATGKYDWKEALEKLSPIRNIELAFHSPENFVNFVKLKEVVLPIIKLGLDVPTIHMAQASLTNLKLFMPVFVGTLKIAKELACQDIVLHPNNGAIKEFDIVFKHVIYPLLEDYNCYLLWETFRGKRRLLTAWEQLAEFCEEYDKHYICYDICHMTRYTAKDVIKDIQEYSHLIKGFHISNWSKVPFRQHLPIRQGLLDYDKIIKHIAKNGPDVNMTLEYLPQFHNQLVTDALYLLERY